MKFLTAEQAREMSAKAIPYDLEMTIEYVMKEIEDMTQCYGANQVSFNDSTPCLYFEDIKSKKFKSFIESLGYSYEYKAEESEWFGTQEEIIISW